MAQKRNGAEGESTSKDVRPTCPVPTLYTCRLYSLPSLLQAEFQKFFCHFRCPLAEKSETL